MTQAQFTIEEIPFFDPIKIANSGQCFRWKILDASHVELVALGRYLQSLTLVVSGLLFLALEVNLMTSGITISTLLVTTIKSLIASCPMTHTCVKHLHLEKVLEYLIKILSRP